MINLIVKHQQQTASLIEQTSKQQSTNGSAVGENDDFADLNEATGENASSHQNQLLMLKHVNVVVQYQLNHIKKKMQHLMLKQLYQKIMQQCKH